MPLLFSLSLSRTCTHTHTRTCTHTHTHTCSKRHTSITPSGWKIVRIRRKWVEVMEISLCKTKQFFWLGCGGSLEIITATILQLRAKLPNSWLKTSASKKFRALRLDWKWDFGNVFYTKSLMSLSLSLSPWVSGCACKCGCVCICGHGCVRASARTSFKILWKIRSKKYWCLEKNILRDCSKTRNEQKLNLPGWMKHFLF